MENNNENKAKFFAQYWGQYVMSDGKDVGGVAGDCEDNLFLILKPLSSITEEHALELSKIVTGVFEGEAANLTHNRVDLIGTYSATLWHDGELIFDDDEDSKPLIILNAYDYLRSNGYALPYMGLSVEELVNRGWIKLKH